MYQLGEQRASRNRFWLCSWERFLLVGFYGTAGLVAFFIARFLPLRTFALFNCPFVRHNFNENPVSSNLLDRRLLRPRLAHAGDEPVKSLTPPALTSREGEGAAGAKCVSTGSDMTGETLKGDKARRRRQPK